MSAEVSAQQSTLTVSSSYATLLPEQRTTVDRLVNELKAAKTAQLSDVLDAFVGDLDQIVELCHDKYYLKDNSKSTPLGMGFRLRSGFLLKVKTPALKSS